MSDQKSNQSLRIIAAGAVGNVIEWYDFTLYGYMAVVISQLFFPHEIKSVALIATFGTFAAGFLMRPLGSAVFGALGDLIGRKVVLITSVVAMVVPTTLLGVMPTYAEIGIWASVLLVVLRLVQGLSVGGEFAGSVTYLIEMAPEDRRGFVTSWTNVGGQIGMLLGAGTPATVLFVMGSESFHDWGWRIPFLFGGVLGAIALVLRSMLPEPDSTPTRPPGEDAMPPRKELPLRRVFRVEPKAFFENMFYCMGYGVLFYITLVYLPTWLSVHTPMDLHEALFIITMVMIPQAVVVPVLALISDRQIRRTTMLVGAYVVGVVVAVPLFLWAADGDRLTVTVTATIFALLVAFPLAITPAMLAESFERGHRLTGYSVSFNTGIALGGGTAPLIATTLIHVTGDKFAPAYYLIFGCLLAAAALWVKKDRSREPLR